MRIPYGKGIELFNKSSLSTQRILSFLMTPIPRSTILGTGFRASLEELERTQWLELSALKKYQEKQLRAIIRHAYRNVPYYNKLFRQRNIQPEAIKTFEDLVKIPILTKADLRNHFDELIASNASIFKYGKSHTSGSTGVPVDFYLDQQNREREYAAKWRQRRWANVNLNSRIATFRAFRGLSGTDYLSGKPRWKTNALSKELEFNVFGIRKETLAEQVKKLRKFKPELIEGLPSAIELLAKYMIDEKIKDVTPLVIQTSSESLSTRRVAIEEGFGCKVLDWYGQSEYVVSAAECPEGNYHVTESGVMEIIRDGEQVSDGEIGEIIGTGLYNYSMPLIRYRTTDVGRCSEEKCTCGRGMPLVRSLEGRVSDSILASEGRIVTGQLVEQYWKHQISHKAPHLEYVHIIQRANTSLLVKIVKSKGYSEKEEAAIVNGLNKLLGPEIDVEFEELSSIPVQRKWRFTESELDISLI